MAKNLLTEYPGKVGPSTAQYPYGEPRDVTVSGDGTGTPWQAELIKDLAGMQQAILSEAGIVPSNTADNAISSQYLDGLKSIGRSIGSVSDLGDGNMNVEFSYSVNGIQILDNQQPAISDSVGGDEQAKINEILTMLRTHGLIAT